MKLKEEIYRLKKCRDEETIRYYNARSILLDIEYILERQRNDEINFYTAIVYIKNALKSKLW